MRKLALLSCLVLVALQASPARADDDQIFGANIKPNIMIFLDSSGSMGYLIPNGGTGAAYNNGTTYNPQTYTRAAVYNLDGSKYANGISNVSSSTARTALTNFGRYDGKINGYMYHLRTGNYLNYMLSQQSAKTKIAIAKSILTSLIDGLDGVRIGVAIFKGNTANFGSGGGASIVNEIITVDDATDKTALKNAINAIDPDGSTPLGAALHDLGKYYAHTLNKPSPPGGLYANPVDSTLASCQPNYIIVMSDGQPNDGSYSWASGHSPDPNDGNGNPAGNPIVSPWVATQLRNQTTPPTGVLIHTIGFAIDASEQTVTNQTLIDVATNGGGNFYSASDEQSLQAALEDAILRIMRATFCFASPVVPTTSANGIDRAYLASFQSDPSSPFWEGHLKAYQRVNGIVPIDPTTKKPLDSAKIWDASDLLEVVAAADRKIYTYINGSRQEFKTSTSDITAAVLGVTTGERDALINLVRGEGRTKKLGDIYHSTPVLVSHPFLPSTDQSYADFRTAHSGRTAVLLAGANDGMLHAFRERDGVELWAFIPPNLLPKLKNFSSNFNAHTYFVDGSPIAADVKIKRPGHSTAEWRTVVIFGERRGGNAYYCLDITEIADTADAAPPVYMWSYPADPLNSPDSEIVETWSEPVIGKVKMDSATSSPACETSVSWGCKYVAFFGGGSTPAQNNTAGRGIFAIDVANGAKVWEYKTTRTSTTTPVCPDAYATSTAYPAGDERRCLNYSIPSNPLAIDLTNDGYIDHVYIGDVAGQLWKVVTTNPATLSGGTSGTINTSVPTSSTPSGSPGKCAAGTWCATRFFTARNTQPNPPDDVEWLPDQAFYYAPTAALDTLGHLWVYIGSGDREHPNTDTTRVNRFFGLVDANPDKAENGTRPRIQNDLADVSTANASDADGWFFRLVASEKVLAQAEVFNNIVFFNTFTPETTATCEGGGGVAKQYAIQMLTGYGAIAGWSSDGTVTQYTTGDISNTRGTVIGGGIPSKPMVVITDTGATVSTTVIQATTDQQLPNNPVPPPAAMRRILFWREVLN
jgi:type IV pilus assembly protein PilY1